MKIEIKVGKKTVLGVLIFLAVIVLTTIFFIGQNNIRDRKVPNSNEINSYPQVLSADLVKIPKINDKQDPGSHEEITTTTAATEQTQIAYTQNNETTQPEQTCTPTLNAVISRPYEYISHLGDNALLISGSYEATCIDHSKLSYEWFIWGGSYNTPYSLFSTTVKPDFSSYGEGTYDVLYRVSAEGLTSEVKTWVWINFPPPESLPTHPPRAPISYSY